MSSVGELIVDITGLPGLYSLCVLGEMWKTVQLWLC